VRSRLVAAALSAALLSLAGRPPGTGLLALAALVPLLWALRTEARPGRAALLAAIAWTGLTVPAFEGALVILPWGFAALVALGSLAPAVAGATHAWLLRASGRGPAAAAFVAALLVVEALARHPSLLGGTAGWASLGYTQNATPLLATAAWSGVSGVTLLVVLANVSVVLLVAPGRRGAGALLAGLVLAGTLAAPLATRGASAAGAGATPSLRIGLVQAAEHRMDMLMARFDRRAAERVMDRFVALTRALPPDVDLAIWGETVLPTPVRDGTPDRIAARALRAAPLVLVGGREWADGAWYNAVFLARDGVLSTAYRKQRPVPLIERDFARGSRAEPLPFGGRRLGMGICLESMAADLARQRVRAGADALVFLTDDTFAGRTFTPEAHLRATAFRAAATGVPVVFANESGPSAVFGPDGDVLVRTRQGEPAAIAATLPPPTGTTPFVRWGDRLAWLGTGVLAVLLARGGAGRGRPATAGLGRPPRSGDASRRSGP
jgi:apolipoprotein N-acyltransferase